MLCIHLKNNNPYFCLAAEEFLLKNFDAEIFLIWQSHDTVVVGKHQCAMGEINYPFVRQNNITVARRISGGGTVFHDAGNVNFAFIKNVDTPAEISFREFTKPIVESLAKLNIKAENSGRNDLIVGSKKISGNAEHIYKNRVLHHGTLLFNSDLENLGQAIKVAPGKYKTKAVQSNRSEVANLSEFLQNKLTLDEFIAFLFQIQLKGTENKMYELTESEVDGIENLVEEKFKTWEWNFGYSPKYDFHSEKELNGKSIFVDLKTVRGIITESSIKGDYFSEKSNNRLAENLIDKNHNFEDIQRELKKISPQITDELVYSFF